MKLRKKTMTL